MRLQPLYQAVLRQGQLFYLLEMCHKITFTFLLQQNLMEIPNYSTV